MHQDVFDNALLKTEIIFPIEELHLKLCDSQCQNLKPITLIPIGENKLKIIK